MQQFEFKEHIVKVYLQRYGSPPKRAGLSRSSYLQGQRKRNLEDKCFDGINKGDTLENFAPKGRLPNAVNVILGYV